MVTTTRSQRERILEYYKSMTYRGSLEAPDIIATDGNYACGDLITIHGTIANNTFTALRFSGTGCILSQAATAFCIELLINKPVETLATISLSTLETWLGSPLGPQRARCALLGLEALKRESSTLLPLLKQQKAR